MNYSPSPFSVPVAAPELARRFAWIMAGLGALIAARFLRMPHLSGFTVQLWGYLNRAVRRFHRALTRPATKVRATRVRVARGDAERSPPVAFPSGRGWIVRELGWEAAAYLTAMETLLAEMGTQAALAHAPGAGRILRPICRMLGVSATLTPKKPVVTAAPEMVAPSVPVIEQGLERTGLPGVVGNCDSVAKNG